MGTCDQVIKMYVIQPLIHIATSMLVWKSRRLNFIENCGMHLINVLLISDNVCAMRFMCPFEYQISSVG